MAGTLDMLPSPGLIWKIKAPSLPFPNGLVGGAAVRHSFQVGSRRAGNSQDAWRERARET